MHRVSPNLPAGYRVEWGSDLLFLHRSDSSTVGAFSARGADPEEVLRAANEDVNQRPATAVQETPGGGGAHEHPCLRVRLCGRFEVLCCGEVVPLGRNAKARGILKYVLAHRAHSVSRDHLMDWLWPESNLRRARWSLNYSIRALRNLLASWPKLAGAPNHLLFEDGNHLLSPAIRVWTDVGEFEAAYEGGRRLEKTGQMPEAAAEYERAIAVYKGDYLMEDLSEAWTMVERERLIDMYMNALNRLAVYYMESGQYKSSIEVLQRLLEREPCYEPGYRLLMMCYARIGMPSRAANQYRLCEEVLRHSLSLEPSAETRVLHTSIVAGRSAK